MVQIPDRLTHTKGSVSEILRQETDSSAAKKLEHAFANDGFSLDEIKALSDHEIIEIEELIEIILDQVHTMNIRQNVRPIRAAILEKLLFLRGFVTLPYTMAVDCEHEYLFPMRDKNSGTVTMLCFRLQSQLNWAKNLRNIQ